METVYNYICPICAIIMGFSFFGFPPGMVLILMSMMAVERLEDARWSIVCRNWRKAFIESVKAMLWGIPAMANIIVLCFAFGWWNYMTDQETPRIDGTYAKVTEVRKEVQLASKTVYEVVVDLGYNQKREATLIRKSTNSPPSIGQIILVASKDGKYYYDQFEGAKIRSIVSWL